MRSPESSIYRFGACELNTARHELRRDGFLRVLEPQVLSILLLLIENRDRVVTKSEFFEEIWNGRAVSESALSSRIKKARRAIGDDGRQQHLIRTIHRRGFRFVGDVALEPRFGQAPGAAEPDGEAMPQPYLGGSPAPTAIASIAVLPFETLGSSDGQRSLAEGLVQDIITRLSRFPCVFVSARGSDLRVSGASADLPAAAAELGVRFLLHGMVQPAGKRVRVNVALCDVTERAQIWAECYDRQMDKFFAAQDEMAEAVAGAAVFEICQSEQRKSRLKPADSLDSWGAFHRGSWHMYRFTEAHSRQAEGFLKRSAELDPNSPGAFAALAFVHWQRAFLELTPDRSGEIRLALDCAQHALSLHPQNPLAHWALGLSYELLGEKDAIREFETAVALNPGSTMQQYSLGQALMIAGDYAASLETMGKAQRLNPHHPIAFSILSVRSLCLSMLGKHEEAVALARQATWQPNVHHHALAMAACTLFLAGHHDSARAYVARLKALRPGYSIADHRRAFPYRHEAHAARLRETLAELGLAKRQ